MSWSAASWQSGGESVFFEEIDKLSHAGNRWRINNDVSSRRVLHRVEHELIRLDLKSESGDWTLCLDDQLKVQRMVDAANTTEVVRD